MVISTKFVVAFSVGSLSTILLIFSMRLKAEHEDSGPVNFNSIQAWSKSIPAILSEDKLRIDHILDAKNRSTAEMRDQFYHFVSTPLQSVCVVGKYFGGEWLSHCGALDGHKYVCLDKFYHDVKTGTCLIYSYGIAYDWSFEEAMAQLGCTVRAFDPTINGDGKPQTDLISFKRIGMATNSNVSGYLTLQDAIELMGDEGKTISYLKVDIEGAELQAISQWIKSGALDRVTQIGIELHTGKTHVGNGDHLLRPAFGAILDQVRQLYGLGFKLISNSNNDCVAKSDDVDHRYFSLMEVVFYKDS